MTVSISAYLILCVLFFLITNYFLKKNYNLSFALQGSLGFEDKTVYLFCLYLYIDIIVYNIKFDI